MKTVNLSTSLKGNGKQSRTIKFYTLGCKVNQYDTQAIREQFAACGFKELENCQPADIYIINTCTVTQRADSESLNFIRRAKRENPAARVVVTGCLTELDSDKIRAIKGVSLIAKNKEKKNITRELLSLSEKTSQRVNDSTKCGISYFKGHTRAFLKIQDGCDNFCAYCKVPYVRGASRSRKKEEIIQEAVRLVKNGFKEIVLTGICLGAYGGDLKPKVSLVDIIKELEKIAGLLRVRLSSIDAGDISDDLIEAIAVSKKLCPHLHIPIQSGDDEILKKMQRRYTRLDYIDLIKKIRSKIPQIAITTDVLVGFPGESAANFQNTLDLIKEILPLKVHIFSYSPRVGTAAAHFTPCLSPQIIKERYIRLKNIAEGCALKYKKQFLNKKLEVLIEGSSRYNPDFWQGYSDNYIKIIVKSKRNLKNQLIALKLKRLDKNYIIRYFC